MLFMDFKELVRIRQSVRDFSEKPVDRHLLEICVEAARLAPSACNAQPWSFIIVDEPKLREQVAQATVNAFIRFNKFVSKAAAIAVVVSEPENASAAAGSKITGRPYHLMDMGMTTEHFCLQAADLGIGTCILGWFQEPVIKKLLNIPESKKIGLLIAIGYSATDKIREKSRKPLESILHYNSYTD